MSRTTTTAARPRVAFQLAVVAGTVHGAVVSGEAADGTVLCSFDVLVAGGDGRTLVPVTCRDLPDVTPGEGEEVAVRGRVEKRFHRAGGRIVARTTLEADEVLVAPTRRALGRLVERARADLEV